MTGKGVLDNRSNKCPPKFIITALTSIMSRKTKPSQTHPLPSALSESRHQRSTHRPFLSGRWFRDLLSGNLIWRGVSAVHVFLSIVWAANLAYHLLLYAQQNVLHEEEGRWALTFALWERGEGGNLLILLNTLSVHVSNYAMKSREGVVAITSWRNWRNDGTSTHTQHHLAHSVITSPGSTVYYSTVRQWTLAPYNEQRLTVQFNQMTTPSALIQFWVKPESYLQVCSATWGQPGAAWPRYIPCHLSVTDIRSYQLSLCCLPPLTSWPDSWVPLHCIPLLTPAVRRV